MTEGRRRWIRDLLVIPTVVGLIVAVVNFSMPLLRKASMELSYCSNEPKISFDTALMEDVELQVNGTETPLLVAQSIRAWNSGGDPIKNLAIKYTFATDSSSFRILGHVHSTKPSQEFGAIVLAEDQVQSKKFVYELLNPGDEFTVSYLTNALVPVSVYAKSEGLKLRKVQPLQGNLAGSILISVAVTSSVLSMLVLLLSRAWTRTSMKHRKD